MAKPAFSPDEPRFQKQGGVEPRSVRIHDGKRGETVTEYRLQGYDVLSRMLSRENITQDQHDAGQMFSRDYQLAGMDMLQAANLAPTVPGETPDKDGVRQRAAMRWRRAVRHLGPIGAECAIRVCCQNMTATDWAHSKGRSPEYGTDRLRECLDELIAVYEVG